MAVMKPELFFRLTCPRQVTAAHQSISRRCLSKTSRARDSGPRSYFQQDSRSFGPQYQPFQNQGDFQGTAYRSKWTTRFIYLAVWLSGLCAFPVIGALFIDPSLRRQLWQSARHGLKGHREQMERLATNPSSLSGAMNVVTIPATDPTQAQPASSAGQSNVQNDKLEWLEQQRELEAQLSDLRQQLADTKDDMENCDIASKRIHRLVLDLASDPNTTAVRDPDLLSHAKLDLPYPEHLASPGLELVRIVDSDGRNRALILGIAHKPEIESGPRYENITAAWRWLYVWAQDLHHDGRNCDLVDIPLLVWSANMIVDNSLACFKPNIITFGRHEFPPGFPMSSLKRISQFKADAAAPEKEKTPNFGDGFTQETIEEEAYSEH